jgi:chemotaxis-related protein WspD
VQRHEPADLQPAPATVEHAAVSHTRAVLRWNQKSVGVLDEQLLGQIINRSLSSASAT